MAQAAVTLISDLGEQRLDDAKVVDGDLWLGEAGLRAATGFTLKPEGLCRDELCFPLPHGRESAFVRDGGFVNVSAFWRLREGAVAHSADRDVWLLGEPADTWSSRIETLEAPDVTLPDAAGRMHSLSDYRGLKVLLATWASW